MRIQRYASRLVFLVLMGFAGAVHAQGTPWADEWQASALEGVLLPQFCWAQMMQVQGPPEYYIPQQCGPLSNHYCLALLKMVRADKLIGHRDWKKILYDGAKKDTKYTLDGWRALPAPGCPLLPHAERTMIKIDTQLKILK